MPSKHKHPSGSGSLWHTALICSTGGGLFWLLRYQLRAWGQNGASEICLHAAGAFTVALIISVALEHRARIEYRDALVKDVFGTVFERLIPPPIFAELVTLLQSRVVKEDCNYWITLKKPESGDRLGHILVERKSSFTVRNLAKVETEYLIRSEGTSYSELKVNEKIIHLKEGKTLRRRLNKGKEVMALEHRILLAPGGSAKIYIADCEAKPLDSETNYIQGTAVIGLTVVVRNEYPERVKDPEVDMLHPGRDDIRKDDFGVYHFDRAILPGQGFQVLWHLNLESEALSAHDNLAA